MTLNRQLIFTVILIFVASFSGTFMISVNNSRQYLNNQLRAHAQDTATMLGLSVSPHLNDQATVDSMVSAVFDRGDYRLIRIEDNEKALITERKVGVKIDGVPGWFVRFVPLSAEVGESLIISGWNQAGRILVESHPGYAYQEAWRNLVGTFFLFLACALLIFTLGLLLLRRVLKPLASVERQAAAICRKEFVVQEQLPKTRELQRIVTVMNTLSLKVKEMFSEQAKLAENLRKKLFSNELTGLSNRRHFDYQLKHLTESPEEFNSGGLFLIGLQNLQQINREMGFQVGDQVLQKTGKILLKQTEKIPQSIVAHFSGSEFAILVPGISKNEADQIADRISHALLELQSLGINEGQAAAHVGLAIYRTGQAASVFYASADLALRSAQKSGKSGWHRNPAGLCESEKMGMGAQNWRRVLQDALLYGRIELYFQPVVNAAGHIEHYEVLTRIIDEQGKLIPASVFIPMIEREGLSIDLDKLVVTAWLAHIEKSKNQSARFAINLSPGSIQSAEFADWLIAQFKQCPKSAARLVMEVAEHGVSCQVETVRGFIKKLAPFSCQFAVDHFGKGFTPFGYLSTVKVEYLKIDGGLIRNISDNKENRFYVEALTKTAHELEILVIAEYVENEEDKAVLSEIRVDGFQGFLLGKPSRNP